MTLQLRAMNGCNASVYSTAAMITEAKLLSGTGYSQAIAVSLMLENAFNDVKIRKDMYGVERFVIGFKMQ